MAVCPSIVEGRIADIRDPECDPECNMDRHFCGGPFCKLLKRSLFTATGKYS